jgi:hypothetical protein
MATCFAKVLQSAPLNSDSQGGSDNPMGALWVLCSFGDAVDSRSDTFHNAATEVKYRLKPFENNRWMKEFATPFLTSLELKLAQQ